MGYDLNAIIEKMMKGYVTSARPFDEMFYVRGKVAIVTGGTSGLGFCVALRLLHGGAKVVISSHSEEESKLALRLLHDAGLNNVSFFKADVTSESEVEALVNYTAETYGSIDILVTAAAIIDFAHVYDMPDQMFVKTLNINLAGAFRAAKFVSRYMIEHKIKGKITFISSNVVWFPHPVFGGYPHYAASKGGLVAMTLEIAKELKRFGIQVNSVAPGAMATPGGAIAVPNPALTQKQQEELRQERSVAKMDEIPSTDSVAIVVYMMCTAVSDGMTGECIVADNGMRYNIVTHQPAIAEYPPKAE